MSPEMIGAITGAAGLILTALNSIRKWAKASAEESVRTNITLAKVLASMEKGEKLFEAHARRLDSQEQRTDRHELVLMQINKKTGLDQYNEFLKYGAQHKAEAES